MNERFTLCSEIKESLNKTKEKLLLDNVDSIENQYVGDDFQFSRVMPFKITKKPVLKTIKVNVIGEIDEVLNLFNDYSDVNTIITGLLHLIKIDSSSVLNRYSFLQKTSFYELYKNLGYYSEIQNNIKKPYIIRENTIRRALLE
ncbi:hypothetical protein [Lysinibacillus sphaericus]|uniref:hypothetical protein n=1 Tax=Lysinibacillus sphaericus TaxID=1421 RepID=UPI0019D557FF|nr:hypothetical protein [Lysinibacillus sphaericus]